MMQNTWRRHIQSFLSTHGVTCLRTHSALRISKVYNAHVKARTMTLKMPIWNVPTLNKAGKRNMVKVHATQRQGSKIAWQILHQLLPDENHLLHLSMFRADDEK
jgi:hypothetical protein